MHALIEFQETIDLNKKYYFIFLEIPKMKIEIGPTRFTRNTCSHNPQKKTTIRDSRDLEKCETDFEATLIGTNLLQIIMKKRAIAIDHPSATLE